MSKVNSGNAVWLSWGEINELTREKRIIFFGRGEWMEKSLNYLASGGDYVVDNNKYEHGQMERGLKIYSPERLQIENWEEIFIIITTSGFQEVEAQLREYGLVPGRHFCVSPSLKNYRVISRINEHKQVIYLTCSDRYLEGELKRGSGLYSFDIQSRQMKKIVNGLCHGIVEGKDYIYLVDDTVGIRVLDKDFGLREEFQLPPKSRPHGIAYCPQRELIFIAFSGRDSIGVYEGHSYKQINEIFLTGKWRSTGIAQHHVNDLCVLGNSLYVSMFSSSGNWKIGAYDGGILEIDIDSRELLMPPVVSNLWMSHSPTIISGTLFYCDSMRGKVYSGNRKLLTEFNGFVRGIVYDGEFYYIGQSMHRYVDRRQGTTNNISLDTGVFMVDDASKATKFFAMPQLTDIHAVFVPSSSIPSRSVAEVHGSL